MAGPLPAEDGTPLPGAYVGAGLTGHGLPYAPVLGMLLAELIAAARADAPPRAVRPDALRRRRPPSTWLGPSQGDVPIPR